jgi:acyl carrier protein
VCGAYVQVEPSRPPGDAPCPNCGTLLWFNFAVGGAWFYEASRLEPIFDRLREILAPYLIVEKEHITLATSVRRPDDPYSRDVGIDSLDLIEVVMNVEDEFHVSLLDFEEADDIETVWDLCIWILEHRAA